LNLLVTGGTGFIGRNLLLELGRSRPDIRVFCLTRRDRFSRDFSHFLRLEGLDKLVVPVSGDLTDRRSLAKAIARSKPDLVLHMAALTPVRNSWRMQEEYMRVNYFGTVNLVNAMRQSKETRLVYYSTMEVLKPFSDMEAFREAPEEPVDFPVYPTSPYAASKLAAEAYVRTQSDVESVVVRPCNTFDRSIMGLNPESMGYFVEKAVIYLVTRREPRFDGSPNSVRTWMHVRDHVEALKTILSMDLKHGQLFHIAPRDSTMSCGELFKLIVNTYAGLVEELRGPANSGNSNSRLENLRDYLDKAVWNLNPRPYDPPVLAMKGGNVPGWRPEDIRIRIANTIGNWFRVFYNAKKI